MMRSVTSPKPPPFMIWLASPPAAGPDPVGGFVSGQRVADAGDPAVWAAAHGESLEVGTAVKSAAKKGANLKAARPLTNTVRTAGHRAGASAGPQIEAARPLLVPRDPLACAWGLYGGLATLVTRSRAAA